MSAATILVEELFRVKRERLELTCLTPELSLARPCEDPDVSSPGLALAGYTARFPDGRMQVLGETEIRYLASLDPAERLHRLDAFLSLPIPAVFITKNQEVGADLVAKAIEKGVPLFRSKLTTKDFFRRLKPFLEVALAPATSVHGSLADVYGVGLLFMGPSGIGKSECVLDLIERGHRLVADDLVLVTQRGNDVLIGRGHELQGHHMEIRGIGIIDVKNLFGIRAIRQQKRIEVVVQLSHWDDTSPVDRTGLEREEIEILGVPIPRVTVRLNPGKNVTVISEVVAMDHLLRVTGVNSAEAFDARLRGAMAQARVYLEEDYE